VRRIPEALAFAGAFIFDRGILMAKPKPYPMPAKKPGKPGKRGC
jgi:hypothetical protein